MGREIILSNVSLFLGIGSIVLVAIPFFGPEIKLYNALLPIILGIAGLFISYNVRKKLNDDVVKGGVFVNAFSIILGLIQLVTYLT